MEDTYIEEIRLDSLIYQMELLVTESELYYAKKVYLENTEGKKLDTSKATAEEKERADRMINIFIEGIKSLNELIFKTNGKLKKIKKQHTIDGSQLVELYDGKSLLAIATELKSRVSTNFVIQWLSFFVTGIFGIFIGAILAKSNGILDPDTLDVVADKKVETKMSEGINYAIDISKTVGGFQAIFHLLNMNGLGIIITGQGRNALKIMKIMNAVTRAHSVNVNAIFVALGLGRN
jgi:hypothetical protein